MAGGRQRARESRKESLRIDEGESGENRFVP